MAFAAMAKSAMYRICMEGMVSQAVHANTMKVKILGVKERATDEHHPSCSNLPGAHVYRCLGDCAACYVRTSRTTQVSEQHRPVLCILFTLLRRLCLAVGHVSTYCGKVLLLRRC